jgi:predicted ThiF/HesA family dinucleotide-utilizing enzyme
MTLLLLVGLGWLGLRTLLLLSQVSRHSPEARLGRAFQQELSDRGLTHLPHAGTGGAQRLMPNSPPDQCR